MEKYKPNKYIGYIPIKMTNSGAHVKYITKALNYYNAERLLTVDNMTGKKQSYDVYYTSDNRSYVMINGKRYYSEQWIKESY